MFYDLAIFLTTVGNRARLRAGRRGVSPRPVRSRVRLAVSYFIGFDCFFFSNPSEWLSSLSISSFRSKESKKKKSSLDYYVSFGWSMSCAAAPETAFTGFLPSFSFLFFTLAPSQQSNDTSSGRLRWWSLQWLPIENLIIIFFLPSSLVVLFFCSFFFCLVGGGFISFLLFFIIIIFFFSSPASTAAGQHLLRPLPPHSGGSFLEETTDRQLDLPRFTGFHQVSEGPEGSGGGASGSTGFRAVLPGSTHDGPRRPLVNFFLSTPFFFIEYDRTGFY